MKKTFVVGIIVFAFCCFTLPSNANYSDVLYLIRATGNTIQNVNSTVKNTTGTVEHSQRFGDRQGGRNERKRDKVNAEQDAERAYNEAQESL